MTQKRNISAPTTARVGKAVKAGEAVTGSGAAGTDGLMQLIKNYSRNHKVKTSITVGVIGYPNVGKSRCVRGGLPQCLPPFTGPFSHTPAVCHVFFVLAPVSSTR